MTRLMPLAFTCLAVLSLCGCHVGSDEDEPKIGFHQGGARPVPKPTPTTKLDTDEEAANTPPPPPSNNPPPPATSTPPASRPADYPYGVPVQGKQGYVTSP